MQEPAVAPAFQELLSRLLTEVPGGAGLTVVPEFVNPGIGRPDIALVRAGAPARAFVELKALDKPANPARWRVAHDKRQAERLRELQCWATSNFVDFFLFERADEKGTARIVPEQALDPTCAEATADRVIRRHDSAPSPRPSPLGCSSSARAAAGPAMLRPTSTGSGPAVWCHGLLSDYHSFRGSYGKWLPDSEAETIRAAFAWEMERLGASTAWS